jgi:cytochrome c peroxidase
LPFVSMADVLHRTDYVLVQDKSFKKHAKAYADDIDLFFKE